MTIATINPTTGEVVRTFEPHSAQQVEATVAAAAAAVTVLAATTFEQRAGWMRAAADIMESEAEDVAQLVTLEMGKTIASARYEVAKSIRGMRWYADHAAEYLADEHPVAPGDVGASAISLRYQPLGTVLAVMPWNYPLWQAIRFAAPALMAGNTGLLKHASNVPQSALYLGEIFGRGGFPVGSFATLLIEGAAVGPIVEDPRIRAVTLTGSVQAGSSVASIAGAHIKKAVLELGGTDAFVVMPSADLAAAATAGVNGRVQNTGQSCIASKRFFIHHSIYSEYEAAFLAAMANQVVGDPLAESTTVGPMATERGRADAHELVVDAVSKGATLLTGGVIPDGPGFYYPPTALAGVTPEMRIFSEECFGPVACLYSVEDAADAIARANDSEFGLSSSVWTTDESEIEAFVGGIEAGGVFVNGLTASFPQVPFGGIKNSGYGRELSALGIREFCNVKTVWRA